MGRLALLTPSCGGQRADREEKRVAHGNEINRQQGRRQEQLDFKDPNQRRLLGIRSFPTREYVGLIFAYLGEGEPPEFPRYADLEDEGILDSREYRRDCNFFNNIENQCDPVHVAFTHRKSVLRQAPS